VFSLAKPGFAAFGPHLTALSLLQSLDLSSNGVGADFAVLDPHLAGLTCCKA
jgi:hypothetical protein